MYTQIILLLYFAVHSLSAYSIVQIELKNGKEVSGVKELSNNSLEFVSDHPELPTLREIIFVVDKNLENNEDRDTTTKRKTPQEIPIELDGSLRAFTNGHGFQFVDWELVDEHQSRVADKTEDKNDKDNDNNSNDADDNDDTAGDETDKYDDNHEVSEIPEIDQRHLDIVKAKSSRNKLFDKIKEKYQRKKRNHVDPTEEVRRKRQLPYQNLPGGALYNLDPTATQDYKNRMLLNTAPYENSKNVMSPTLRDDHGNILYDNINTMYSGGRQFGNTPRAYGMNLNNDQGYPLNYVNNIQNEPMYNYNIKQPVQHRPMESTVNNNVYKQVNTSEVAVSNVQQLTKSEINDIDNIQKFNQVTSHETLNRVPKEVENKSIPQVIEKENASYNGEVNTTTLKHNKEMLHNVNQISKKIGSIKGKVKDRFANILNTPEGMKLLTHGMTKTGHKGQTRNDTATPHVQVNDLPPHSSNLTTNDNLKVNPNNTIAINNIEDTNVIQSNCSNEINDTNISLVELAENIDIEINEKIENPVKKTANSHTVNQNNTEPATNQTIVQNKCENLELPATEILTTACTETEIIEKGKVMESTSYPVKLERLNGTASTEVKEEACTELEEIIVATPIANKTSEGNCNSQEKCDAYDSKVDNVNFNDLLNTQNNTEPATNQIIVQNKCENLDVPATEILTTACNETGIIEKNYYKESTLDSVELERLNGTASTEIKEETCTELEEIIVETEKESPVANKTSEGNCNSQEKCDADDGKVDNVNFDDLLIKDNFWAWLSKWTTAYMEILKGNVEVMVKEEVAKQLEEMFSKAEKEMANHSEKVMFKRSI